MLQLFLCLSSRFHVNCYQKVSLGAGMSSRKELEYAHTAMRQKRKLKLLQGYCSTIKLQVLGSGTIGTPASILVTSDHINYVFNCGEGMQRLAHEHRIKLTRIDHVFVTRCSWNNIGGIPGLALTMQECGLTDLNVHSPNKMSDILNAIKTFVYMPTIQINTVPINESEPYKDNVITVTYVPIKKLSNNPKKSSSELFDENRYRSNVNGKRVIDAKETQKDITKAEKKLKTTPDVVCYACEVQGKPGKFKLEKCFELGLKPGPLFKALKQGTDVIQPDGTVISKNDVCYPEGPKVTFLVIECPDEEYLDSVVNHPTFSKYHTEMLTTPEDKIFCIFHFTPENIFNNPKYQDWIKKFSEDTEHIILNTENNCMGTESVYKTQYLLHMLHPEIFPLLKEDCFEDVETKSDNIHRAKTMQTLQLRPCIQKSLGSQIALSPEQYIESVTNTPNFPDILEELQTNINKKTAEHALTNECEYPEIVMLGTGSSVPNKVRNTSSILLRIDEDNSIMMDCGEGTVAQLKRFYGKLEFDNILRTIKTLYVSHIHADHHLGLINLLQTRAKVTNDPIYLMIPPPLGIWLTDYNNIMSEKISHLYTSVSNTEFFVNIHQPNEKLKRNIYSSLNVKEINTVFVKHCKFSYGIAIILKDGKKIVYSGDTMPCEALSTLGANCDLLIHEATMDDSLASLAKQKYHSTISQAINAGKLMNAKFILLTHFSQRYSKIPMLSQNETNVGVAYDNMRIKFSQLPLLPLFYPCLKLMFTAYYQVIEKRTQKKVRFVVNNE